MPAIHTIKKRNGSIVLFEPSKITVAMKKAFIASNVKIAEEDLMAMTDAVVISVAAISFEDNIPNVENVQDAVEKEIMKRGHFNVAKAYILYRFQHSEDRKKAVEKKIEQKELHVIKQNGARELFSLDKIEKTVRHYTKGIEDVVDVKRIVSQCNKEVYDEIKTREVTSMLIMVARSLTEFDPAYGKLAARILQNEIYKEVIGRDRLDYKNFEEEYRQAFIRNIKRGVEIGRLDERLLDFNLKRIAAMLEPRRDDHFEYLGIQTLYDRYFVRDYDDGNRVLETPQMFWMRVALGSALPEDAKDREMWAQKFYEIMSGFLYTPSTPTLFHAGTPKPQLSSCYLNTVPDSLDGIFKTYADNAQLSKWSGGIGTDWTPVRGTGSFIKGTGVESQGVVPFLKIANDVTVAINRSGRRRGAACVYLETWHYDIVDFLELRKNTGDERRRTHDMDTANWIPDLFMKRVRDEGDWTLFSPEEVPDLHDTYGKEFEKKYVAYERMARAGKIKLWKRMPASDLWKKMLAMLFETGHPWITFKDPSNIRSPQDHAGVVHSSNLCTEITLNTAPNETAVCNLGSLNFAKFVRHGAFDKELVGKVAEISMRMLDNVIDINFYPTKDAERSNMRHRPVGLGIRGFHDALYLLDIDFDSDECVRFADESMEAVSYHAILSSSKLAKERGAYKSYKGSKWDRGIFPQDTLDLLELERGVSIPVSRGGMLDWKPVREHVREYGMRNSNCLAIAPTATTANIVGCVPTIEPIYKNMYVKSNQAGDFVVVNKYLIEELKAHNLWNEKLLEKIKYHDGSIQSISEIPEDIRSRFKEVFEIDQKWLIKSAARRGKWIDQSQSLNMFFSGTSGRELSEVYFYAWEMGLKTTYYLRTLGASQVEKSTIRISEHGETHTRKSFVMRGQSAEAIVSVSAPEPVYAAKAAAAETEKEGKMICESCEG
ncbi:ribonucleoside-diphosphate reductase subunit alpha [bacterium]|nr:ribonucleoside-diphosphate reductase subunit alpha [bacterium]